MNFNWRVVALTLYVIFCDVSGRNVTKIAIIGGGIGGCSSAYFFEELFGRENVQIDVYEPNKIGGRLAVENIDGNYYELGGSVIHPRNKYMVEFSKLFDLRKRSGEPSKFGIYDGKEFLYSEDSNWDFMNTLKFFWRYGMDAFKLQRFIDNMLDNFERIYTLQANHYAYNNVEDMLAAMSEEFVKDIHISTGKGFEDSGFLKRTIDELVAGSLLVNYGQTTDVHKFVGAVSVAGATNGLWAIEGGNWLAAKKALEYTRATLMKTKVFNITLNTEDNSFEVSHSSGNPKIYNIVILALPMVANTKPDINFINFPDTFLFYGQYFQTVCTLVSGDINRTYFGIENDEIQEIFLNKKVTFFRSVGKINPVNYKNPSKGHSVWKIFSDEELNRDELSILFTNINEVRTKKWFAGPHYNAEQRTDKFTLFDNLYHVNAIEWAASAMEMSVIGAKNVALLAYNNLHKGETNHMKDEL